VHGVISAAREWVDRPKDQMLAMFEAQCAKRCRPHARRNWSAVIVIEKRATFSPLPASIASASPGAPK